MYIAKRGRVLREQREREPEEAAVARAVEDSIVSEAMREREGRRLEAEVKVRDGRLRRRAEGTKVREWARGGMKTPGWEGYSLGVPPLRPRLMMSGRLWRMTCGFRRLLGPT